MRLHAIQAYLSLGLITHSHSPSFSRRWLVVCLLRYDPRRCSRSPTPFDSLYTCVATTFVCAMRFWLSFTLFLSLVWLSRTLLICLTLLHAFFLRLQTSKRPPFSFRCSLVSLWRGRSARYGGRRWFWSLNFFLFLSAQRGGNRAIAIQPWVSRCAKARSYQAC